MQVDKPGLLTTEFWTALIAQIMPLLVTLGVVGPNDVSTLEGALTKMVTTAAAFIASAWVIVSYIRGRVAVKAAAQSKSTTEVSVAA